jgi:hypothetical protein
MFKLQRTELDEARQALEKHGVVSFLPPPPEWNIVRANWNKVCDHITLQDLDTYIPYTPLYTFAPKHLTGLRPITSLHIQDLIIYTSLVLLLRDSIEGARLPESVKKSFSYRAKIGEYGALYRSSGSYEKYRKRTEDRLKLKRTKFVATLDISDYFPRLYQHRVRGAVEAAITSEREKEAMRTLDKLIGNFGNGGISYGIPIGPYASRNLGEAVLIDVDATLHGAGVDFVRWLDDFTIFSKTEDEAQEAIYYISSWLHSHHGLSANQSKTRIYSKGDFLTDVWKSYDEEHQDFRQAVQHVRVAFGYDDETDEVACDDEDFENGDDDEDFDVNNESEVAAVKETFERALTIEAEPKYGFIRFLLDRVIFQPGLEDGRDEIIDSAMSEVWRLKPVFDSLAKALAKTNKTSAELEVFVKSFLKKLKQERLFIPGHTLAWFCWLVGEKKLRGLASEMKRLAEKSRDDCVVREALIALGAVGSRNDVIALKDRRAALPNSSVVALVFATQALGKDEREHWKKHPPMNDFYEKLVFSQTSGR